MVYLYFSDSSNISNAHAYLPLSHPYTYKILSKNKWFVKADKFHGIDKINMIRWNIFMVITIKVL
jgi:hypothetical protein